MDKRIKVGIIFEYTEIWTGGVYYILNLIAALKTLPDIDKPFISVFYNDETQLEPLKQINYPYTRFYPLYKKLSYSLAEKILNKISKSLFKKQLIDKRYKSEAQACFPYSPYYYSLLPIKNKIFWIPDFQEHYLPEFFKPDELKNRKQYQALVAQEEGLKVFSSKDAENDFRKFYPEAIGNSCVLNFAVTLPETDHISIDHLYQKYKINNPYFICPNQFWAHKNHIIVLKAIKELRKKQQEILVVFTGKEQDYRNPNYFSTLIDYVKENDLEQNVRFLGFIDRAEQLLLIKHSISVIQPSLFEGWSTVVEDAKSLNQFIILSDLKVHREQLNYNVDFFNPSDEFSLIKSLEKVIKKEFKIISMNYENNRKKFAEDFLKIISSK